MAKIVVLPPHEALKIAAGEVIERPANVIKELIENALDAGATTISVSLKDAGKTLIRIVDNGCGMASDDAELCFLAHATSKIRSIDDLTSVATFGFRGEALASVAAISKVTLRTKEAGLSDDALGVMVVCLQNVIQANTPVACPVGTDISIEDLFFNTPVRKKFLKQDQTEWNAAATVVEAFALSHPLVHFKLSHNDVLMLNAPPVGSIKDRAAQVWEQDVAQSLVPLSTDDTLLAGKIRLRGFISQTHLWRYGRTHLCFFVNNRWVKNAEISKGLLKGYSDCLPPGRFPAALIFIEVDAQSLDVNIHPKKEEVKFVQPGVVQTALAALVKKTLEVQVSEKVSWQPNTDRIKGSFFENSIPALEATYLYNQIPMVPERVYAETKQFFKPQQGYVASMLESVTQQGVDFKLAGTLFNTYLILEKEHEVVFIDQHAAHERILYEKHKHTFLQQQGTQLLFPEVLNLSQELIPGLVRYKDFFAQQGIQFDALGQGQLVLRTAPPQLRGPSAKEFVLALAHFIFEQGDSAGVLDDKMNAFCLEQMACKGAVKAGDVLSEVQIKQLLADLDQVPNRFICVHGRPTTWSIPKAEFEKRFRRRGP